MDLIDDHFADFVIADGVLCLIDSIHSHEPERLKEHKGNYLQNHAIHFKCSTKPLNTMLIVNNTAIPCYSAGDERHNYAPFACIDSVFTYLVAQSKVNQFVSFIKY